jgi:hypothetical protein
MLGSQPCVVFLAGTPPPNRRALMNRFLPVLLFTVVAPTLAAAQANDDIAAVRAVVLRMFEGMKLADSAMVRSTFDPGARFAMRRTVDGKVNIVYSSPDGWISGIARSNRQWEERLFDTEIRVDGDIASVWTGYNFYLNGALRHCGVDTIELIRTDAGWKVTQLSDSQRREGCKERGDNQPAAPAADTLRFEVGAKEVDGRVYKPHAARVRVWVGPGEGRMRSEWTNVLHVGDSAGRPVHHWTTTGTQVTPAGDSVKWELRQTYDAITLQPYSIVRTASNGALSALRIDGLRVHGTRRANATAPVEQVDYTIDRLGYVASASDLVPAAVGFKPGLVISVPIWGPPMTKAEQRIFTVIGKTDVNVEGKVVNAWKVEERRHADKQLLATWWLLDKSPYMVYGEVPLADGTIQRMTEVEVPMPNRR